MLHELSKPDYACMGDTPRLPTGGIPGREVVVNVGKPESGWRISTADIVTGTAIITKSAAFLEVNESFASMVGIEAEQLTAGVRAVDASYSAARERLQLDLKNVTKSGPGRHEAVLHHASGRAIPVEVRVMELDNDDPTMPKALLCSVTDRSGEEEEVERLTRGELRATQALNSFPESIAILDEKGTILATNRSWDRFADANGGANANVGVGENYLRVCGKSGRTCEDARIANRAIRDVAAGKRDDFEFVYACHSPEEERWYELSVSRFRELGETRVVVCHENITDRWTATNQLAMQAQLLAEVDAAVIASDLDGKIVYWNRGATVLFGVSQESAIGQEMEVLLEGLPALPDCEAEPHGSKSRTQRATLRGADGKDFVAGIVQNVHKDNLGKPAGRLTIVTDVTERARREKRMAEGYDYMLAVGQSLGDGLLTIDANGRVMNMNPSGERMLGVTESDAIGNPVSEFIGFDVDVEAENDLWSTRVDDGSFLTHDGREIPVAYTISPFSTASGTRGAVITFTDITAQKQERIRLEQEIEDAIWSERIKRAFALDQFELYVQPIFSADTRERSQNELLIRMIDEGGDVISPGEFLPAAERQGLIGDIDRWVIRRAANLAGEGHLVEFNLSASSLTDPDLAEFIIDELEAAGADNENVVVELTETAILENEEHAEDCLRKLRANGIKIALDDFGTGYGSFTYLKRLPVDFLKIDIEFVRDLPVNESSRNVVEAVVRLAESFNLQTVAEGVEDEETIAMLKSMGVDHLQGYALGRPQPYFIEDAG